MFFYKYALIPRLISMFINTPIFHYALARGTAKEVSARLFLLDAHFVCH